MFKREIVVPNGKNLIYTLNHFFPNRSQEFSGETTFVKKRAKRIETECSESRSRWRSEIEKIGPQNREKRDYFTLSYLSNLKKNRLMLIPWKVEGFTIFLSFLSYKRIANCRSSRISVKKYPFQFISIVKCKTRKWSFSIRTRNFGV